MHVGAYMYSHTWYCASRREITLRIDVTIIVTSDREVARVV